MKLFSWVEYYSFTEYIEPNFLAAFVNIMLYFVLLFGILPDPVHSGGGGRLGFKSDPKEISLKARCVVQVPGEGV